MRAPITLKELEDNLLFFKKMYHVVRLVDPVQKVVLEKHSCAVGETAQICHDYWERGSICDNCISIRAYLENDGFVKLEHTPEAVMMVMAIPILCCDRPVVLELLKDATNSILVGSGEYEQGHMMRELVSQMNDVVVRDSLTGLYNRRFVNDRLPVDIVKAAVAKQPLSVLFLDLDNLKSINDSYGHPTGDRALVKVSEMIQGCIRSDTDWAARYGGDELLICLNGAPEEQGRAVGERIRRDIEASSVQTPDGTAGITASLGLYTLQDEKLTVEELISRADRNMYRAKKEGKNCIVYGKSPSEI
ncbi:GGDEF domain-containing protein [Papillibacter cinnamivorans]|uniref:Diguanylate cyclase (GGDEF) domain-containing protein n=1 Tax=Papillibacter cinnamivorans DSM 12816 TaxID=1122930 RepID=A0A1W2D152_9FIRM|nr:GGDEF domain-containing protein [Papillibacter cinnamivorans]SMC91203.1 diguanylate cyclase (GGDEF) domain-containing protein [Papillibacter cinnamivorans DSM 12816]